MRFRRHEIQAAWDWGGRRCRRHEMAGDGRRRGERRGAGHAGGRWRSGPRAARPWREGGSAGGGRCRSGSARRAPSAAASALPRERHGAQRRVWFPPGREAGCSPPWNPGFVPLLGPQEKGGPGGEKPAGGRADKTLLAGPGLQRRACPSDWASSRDAPAETRPGGRFALSGGETGQRGSAAALRSGRPIFWRVGPLWRPHGCRFGRGLKRGLTGAANRGSTPRPGHAAPTAGGGLRRCRARGPASLERGPRAAPSSPCWPRTRAGGPPRPPSSRRDASARRRRHGLDAASPPRARTRRPGRWSRDASARRPPGDASAPGVLSPGRRLRPVLPVVSSMAPEGAGRARVVAVCVCLGLCGGRSWVGPVCGGGVYVFPRVRTQVPCRATGFPVSCHLGGNPMARIPEFHATWISCHLWWCGSIMGPYIVPESDPTRISSQPNLIPPRRRAQEFMTLRVVSDLAGNFGVSGLYEVWVIHNRG